jgi:hypothetical protein
MDGLVLAALTQLRLQAADRVEQQAEVAPSVYYRLADNALEMTARFVVPSTACPRARTPSALLGSYSTRSRERASPLRGRPLAINAFPAVRLDSLRNEGATDDRTSAA